MTARQQANAMRRGATVAVALAFVSTACGPSLRPFPPRPPVQHDTDDRPFGPRPEEYYSPFAWDALDMTVFRPLSQFFRADPAGRAANANALDEVPDSTWFTNRLGTGELDYDQAIAGPCTGPPLDPAGPWEVVGAKRDGANPGFQIQDARNRRYLLKFDAQQREGYEQPERATFADVIASRIYWAAGYFVPCNQIVYFRRDAMVMSSELEGRQESIIDDTLALATQADDGTYRAMASEFVPGRPLGPWTYDGVRWDDPNDAIAHQDRRELRGAYVLAALVNHFDTREKNTLAVCIDVDSGEDSAVEQGYVRHYYLDFGDCFGSLWAWDQISRRLGYANYFDIREIAADLLTFGLRVPVWQRREFGPAGSTLGYYDDTHFEPDEWDPGYPNPAFSRHTERDAAWMARILAFMTDDLVEGWVAEGRLSDPIVESALIRIMKSRRDAIAVRYLLGPLSPLSLPRVTNLQGTPALCLRDLAVVAHLTSPPQRRYEAESVRLAVSDAAPLGSAIPGRRRGEVCWPLPDVYGTPESPHFVAIDARAATLDPTFDAPTARVHLYHRGEAGWLVAGLERFEAER